MGFPLAQPLYPPPQPAFPQDHPGHPPNAGPGYPPAYPQPDPGYPPASAGYPAAPLAYPAEYPPCHQATTASSPPHSDLGRRAGSSFAPLWNDTGAPQVRLLGRVWLMVEVFREEQREAITIRLDPGG